MSAPPAIPGSGPAPAEAVTPLPGPPGCPRFGLDERPQGSFPKFVNFEMLGTCAMTNRLFLDLDLDRRNPFERHTVKDILAMILIAAPVTADAKCRNWQSDCSDGGGSSWSWQKPKPATSWAITNKHRQRLGDIYNPGHGRRVQIRDTSRRIIGYIERDGTVTNTHRQKVGTLDW